MRGAISREFDERSRIGDREADSVIEGVVGERASREDDGVGGVHSEP